MTKCHFIGGSCHGTILSLTLATNWIQVPRPSKTGWDAVGLFIDESVVEFNPVAMESYQFLCRFADIAVYIGELITDAHKEAFDTIRYRDPAVGYALWMESCFSGSLETDLTFQLRLMMLHQESGLTRHA